METSEECREREEEELMCVWKVRETGTLQPRAAAYLRDDLAVEREVSTAVGARIDALTVQVLLEDPPHCCKNYATRTTGVVEKRSSKPNKKILEATLHCKLLARVLSGPYCSPCFEQRGSP